MAMWFYIKPTEVGHSLCEDILLLTKLLLGVNEYLDPAGHEQMYMWDAGTLDLSGMHYFHSVWQFLVKMQLGLSVQSSVYTA